MLSKGDHLGIAVRVVWGIIWRTVLLAAWGYGMVRLLDYLSGHNG